MTHATAEATVGWLGQEIRLPVGAFATSLALLLRKRAGRARIREESGPAHVRTDGPELLRRCQGVCALNTTSINFVSPSAESVALTTAKNDWPLVAPCGMVAVTTPVESTVASNRP